MLSITEQQLRMWFVVPLLLHSLHLSEVPYFHLLRLAGVGRVSMDALSMNLSVPDFNWNILDFQIRSIFSLAAKELTSLLSRNYGIEK